MRPARLAAPLTLFVLLAARLPAAEPDAPALPKKYVEWLEEVELLLTAEEREYFLSLEENFRRNAFIAAFWKQRDAWDDTEYVELKVHWDERAREARSRWGRLDDGRAQVFLVQGEPYSICLHRSQGVEIWVYDEGDPEAVIRSGDDDPPDPRDPRALRGMGLLLRLPDHGPARRRRDRRRGPRPRIPRTPSAAHRGPGHPVARPVRGGGFRRRRGRPAPVPPARRAGARRRPLRLVPLPLRASGPSVRRRAHRPRLPALPAPRRVPSALEGRRPLRPEARPAGPRDRGAEPGERGRRGAAEAHGLGALPLPARSQRGHRPRRAVATTRRASSSRPTS